MNFYRFLLERNYMNFTKQQAPNKKKDALGEIHKPNEFRSQSNLDPSIAHAWEEPGPQLMVFLLFSSRSEGFIFYFLADLEDLSFLLSRRPEGFIFYFQHIWRIFLLSPSRYGGYTINGTTIIDIDISMPKCIIPQYQ